MASSLFFFFTFLSLSFVSTSVSLSPNSLTAATDALSSSNFTAMSLTLESTSQTLTLTLSSLTLFSPPDSAFASSGQPPLSLLNLHASPRRLPPQSLASLALGSKIQTLVPNVSLTVTTSASDGQISLNGVKINGGPIFDDGSVTVYEIDRFFDPTFDPSSLSVAAPTPSTGLMECKAKNFAARYRSGAQDKIRSIGYSMIADFLDLQLFWNQSAVMTVFAPLDIALMGYGGNFGDYAGVLLRHVVPCRVRGRDLEKMTAGTMLSTVVVGFEINVDRSGGRVFLNGVDVQVYDLYADEFMVIHGISDALQQLVTSVEFG